MRAIGSKVEDTAAFETTLALLKNEDGFSGRGEDVASFGFRFGPLSLELRAPGRTVLDALAESYRDYLRSPEGGVAVDFVPLEHIPVEARTELLREAPLYPEVRTFAGEDGLEEGEIAFFRWDFRALVDLGKRRGRALVSEHPTSFDAVARIAASLFLPRADSLLVHGASFELDGMGIVALGPSGSGKTTLAEMSGRLVLSDEISLLTIEPGSGLSVWGTPFTGMGRRSANRRLSVGRLLFLVKDDTAFLEPMPPFPQFASLMRNVVSYRPDIEGFDLLSRLCRKALDLCPAARLHFARNRDFMEVLRWS